MKLLKEMGVGLVDPNAPEGSIMAEAKERAERREVEKEQRREEREEERARREEERALAAARQPEPEPQEAEEQEEEDQAVEEGGEAGSRQAVSEGIPSRTAAAPAPARQRRANIGAKRTPSAAQRAAYEHAEKLDIGRLAAELERQGFPLPPGVSHAAMKAALVGHLSKRSLTATPQDMFDEFDADGSGSLERGEIALVCASLGDLRGEEGLDDLFDAVDLDGSGSISLEEFETWWAEEVAPNMGEDWDRKSRAHRTAEGMSIAELAVELDRHGFPVPAGVSHEAMKCALVGHMTELAANSSPAEVFEEYDLVRIHSLLVVFLLACAR